MKTYPIGVLQNMNVLTGPPSLHPVPEDNWRMFAPSVDAETGLGMILGVIQQGVMVDAEVFGGMYAQFVYWGGFDVHARICVGTARDSQGVLSIMEYPSDIFDRDTTPMPFIDAYQPGQPHALKVQRLSGNLGQLYWSAA